VTGGAGFIGSHVVERLLAAGHEVRVLDNLSTGRRENLAAVGDHVELLEADVRDRDAVGRAARGCEAVLHQAALVSVQQSIADPGASLDVNVRGTLTVLLAARAGGARRVVLASSCAVYGSASGPLAEEAPPAPISPYGADKVAAEAYGRALHEVRGVETVALRYFNVFGPRQDPTSEYAAVIPRFATACLEGRAPVVYGDGEQSRDFVFVEDVAEANMRALDAADASGGAFNVARGESVTLNRLLDELGAVSGRRPRPVHEPSRSGDIRHSLADTRRAAASLRFRAGHDLRSGLAATLEALQGGRQRRSGPASRPGS
jgi:nucleoside-diphosphate-sugar epimerase